MGGGGGGGSGSSTQDLFQLTIIAMMNILQILRHHRASGVHGVLSPNHYRLALDCCSMPISTQPSKDQNVNWFTTSSN